MLLRSQLKKLLSKLRLLRRLPRSKKKPMLMNNKKLPRKKHPLLRNQPKKLSRKFKQLLNSKLIKRLLQLMMSL